MARLRIAATAVADLREIGLYTLARWGSRQARQYLGDLDSCFLRLVNQPELGKNADSIRPGLLRMRQGRHVIFYRKTNDGVRIIRILHERMLPELHFADEEGDESG